jgi:transposase
MRYELNDYEWRVIKPMLPNKPRGVPRVETDASSMASFGSCDQVRRGVICCPWVSFSWSMETVGEPYGFYPKLLKWKHFVPSVPKSLGQRVLRKIRSLEHFPAVCPRGQQQHH